MQVSADVSPVARARPPVARTLIVAALIVYALACLAGLTTSSISVNGLRSTPESSGGLLLGQPRDVRSDEYLRHTPWRIGLSRAGDADFATPLSTPDPFAGQPGAPLTTLLYPDLTILRTLGQLAPTLAFALVWWLPTLLVVLLLPAWFRRLGVGLGIGLPLTVVVVLAPVSAWWSWEAHRCPGPRAGGDDGDQPDGDDPT